MRWPGGQFLRCLCGLLPWLLPCDIASSAEVAIQGTSLVDLQTGKAVRGFHAVYQDIGMSYEEVDADLQAMKDQFGLKGLTIEIGWDRVEPSRGNFVWEDHWADSILDMAHQKGLYVNLILTAHYTPDWVYNQGIDVHIKDDQGNNATAQWLNYAPSSPAALEWQGDFQRAVVEHYKDKPALLSVNVTNEVTYNNGAWVDYSSHAQTAWEAWLTSRNLPIVSMPTFSEANSRAVDWRNWTLFRQDQMNNYFNTSYDDAQSALTADDQTLVFHRHNWYRASDAFATLNGIYLDPNLQNKADVVGGNNYHTSNLMAAMMVSANKPIFVTETSLNSLDNGTPPPPGEMNAAMLTQFFQGAQNQTLYKFGYSSYFPMREDAATPLSSFTQFKRMTQMIDKVSEVQLDTFRQVGYLWPRNFASVNALTYANDLYHLHEGLMTAGRAVAQSPVSVFPSFFTANQPSQPLHDSLKLIYATRNQGMDQATINSTGLRDWVSAGGTLFLELDVQGQLPSWLSGVGMFSTTRTSFSTNSTSPFGVISNIPMRNSQRRFTGLDEVWATWNGGITTHVAAGVKNYGQGKVVLLGSNVLNEGAFNPIPGMNNYVFGNEHLNQSWQYYRLGHNVLVTPGGNSSGPVYLPRDWLGTLYETYLMDLTSGLFTQIDWSSIDNDRYVFNVPSNHLLLAITVPESSTLSMVMLGVTFWLSFDRHNRFSRLRSRKALP